jgi:hypothetical protein
MKMTVFWHVAKCSLVEIRRHFRGTHCLHHQGEECLLMTEEISTSETSVYFYQSTRSSILEESQFHTRENLKSHQLKNFLTGVQLRCDNSFDAMSGSPVDTWGGLPFFIQDRAEDVTYFTYIATENCSILAPSLYNVWIFVDIRLWTGLE